MKSPPIRLMLVDDHALLRMELKALLEIETSFVVVAEAGDGVAEVNRLEAQRQSGLFGAQGKVALLRGCEGLLLRPLTNGFASGCHVEIRGSHDA